MFDGLRKNYIQCVTQSAQLLLMFTGSNHKFILKKKKKRNLSNDLYVPTYRYTYI